jgi:trimeric autotransporter adhesin
MDATHTFRKLALIFAAALLGAGALSAATLSVNPDTVTLGSCVGCATSFQVISSDGSATPFTATVTSAGQQFFSTPPSSGTASGVNGTTITLSRLSSCGGGIAACPDGKITIHGGTGPDVVVTVKDATGTSGGGGGGGTSTVYSANPNPINLSASNGFSTSTVVTLSSASVSQDTITPTLSPANSWLTVFPASAVVSSGNPAIFQITTNSAALNPNTTYNGSVTFTGSNGTLNVPVNFTVGSGTASGSIVASPNAATLQYPCGTCSAAIALSSSTATTYTASSNQNWLYVNGVYSSIGTITSGLTVSVNFAAASTLPTGTYNGIVSLQPDNGSPTNIQVTLSVNGASGGGTSGTVAAPTSLSYAYQIGKASPACQSVAVTGSDTYTITSTGRFFSNTSSVTGGNTFAVCATVFGASTGTSTGSVVLTSTTNGTSQTIPATLIVSDTTAPVVMASVAGSTLGDIVCASTGGCTATVTVFASDNSVLPIAIATANSWIVLGGSPTATPATFTVQVNAAGMAGLNNGSITITPTGAANGTLTIPVVLSLAGSSTTTGNLTVNPSSVTFTAAGTQSVSVTSSTASFYTAALSSQNCTWLSILNTGTIPGTVTLTATNPGINITCNVNLTANGTTQSFPVTFNPNGTSTGGTIGTTQSSLSFTTSQGVAPATQTLHITGTAGTAVTVNPVLASWLTLNPSGTTLTANGADITVGVNPGNLGVGTNSGYIVISPASGTAIQIPVTLTVTAASTVSATPTTLSFAYTAGTTVPSAQTISVTGQAAGLPFSANVTSGSDWLSVTPTSGTAGTTPTTLSVSVNPTSLQVNKTYTGTIVVAGTGTATGSTTITVTLNVAAPLPTITRVTNAASFNSGAISAGEIVTIFGTSIGPAALTVASPTNGVYPTELAGVQVTIGGVLAPLIYVRGDQVSAIVPYEVNRPIFIANLAVVVRYLGQGSNGITLQQSATAPGVFTTGNGTGQAAALNQNLSVNSAGNPANKGEVIVLYLTGEGQTTPAGVTGKITSGATTTPVSGQVTVTIDGVPAQVQYAGEAPGLVAGVMQVNAVIPAGLTRSGDMPVVVSVGGASSQTDSRGIGAATIAVR